MAPFCFGRESFDQYYVDGNQQNSTETQTLGFTGFMVLPTFGAMGWVDGTQNTQQTQRFVGADEIRGQKVLVLLCK
jgi:hypothetical protein